MLFTLLLVTGGGGGGYGGGGRPSMPMPVQDETPYVPQVQLEDPYEQVG